MLLQRVMLQGVLKKASVHSRDLVPRSYMNYRFGLFSNKQGKNRARLTLNSPLFSSCAPGSVRYCLETWTQWQGWARERASGEGDRLKLWCPCILLSLLYLIQCRNAVAHHQTQSNLSWGTARHGSAGVNRKQDYFGLTRFWTLLSDGWYVMIFAS